MPNYGKYYIGVRPLPLIKKGPLSPQGARHIRKAAKPPTAMQ